MEGLKHDLSGCRFTAAAQILFAEKALKSLLESIDTIDVNTVNQVKGEIHNYIEHMESLKDE